MNHKGRKGRNFVRLRGNSIEVFGRNINLPSSRPARVATGAAFVTGGIFSFLPVLGIWMLPVGLLILSIDFASVRRLRRRTTVKWGRRKGRPQREDATMDELGFIPETVRKQRLDALARIGKERAHSAPERHKTNAK